MRVCACERVCASFAAWGAGGGGGGDAGVGDRVRHFDGITHSRCSECVRVYERWGASLVARHVCSGRCAADNMEAEYLM